MSGGPYIYQTVWVILRGTSNADYYDRCYRSDVCLSVHLSHSYTLLKPLDIGSDIRAPPSFPSNNYGGAYVCSGPRGKKSFMVGPPVKISVADRG